MNSKEENSSKTFVPTVQEFALRKQSKIFFLNCLVLMRPDLCWGGGRICRHSVLFCMNVCSEVGEKGRVVYQEKGRLFRFFRPWLSTGRSVLHQSNSQKEKVPYILTVHTVRYVSFFSVMSSFAYPNPHGPPVTLRCVICIQLHFDFGNGC